MPAALHLDLDAAWEDSPAGLPTLAAREWGPRLRFAAPSRVVEDFWHAIGPQLPPFVLYGSGDFHYLTALWLRRVTEPIVVVSFDNHPDWDVRPPRWACGGWVNRALELPHVQKVSVWGCGNFECWWPAQFFGNRRAERAGQLEVHAWADHQRARRQQRRGAIFLADWREIFLTFVEGLGGSAVYVTVDLDCLRAEEAVTNWENGLFTAEDVAWAIGQLRSKAQIVGGDICGAFSPARYARAGQRFISEFDHPKARPLAPAETQRINRAALARIWPVLAHGHEHEAGRDQERTNR